MPGKRIAGAALLLLGWIAALPAAAAATEGHAAISVTTRTTKKQFAPRHVLAIWIENDQGQFVRTLKYRAKTYRMYLVEWRKATRGVKTPLVDAITGASLRKHETQSVTWDGKDWQGQTSPDGFYRVRVEFSEKNGRGPVTPARYIRFMKGEKAVTTKPKPLPYFKDIVVEYKPSPPGTDGSPNTSSE